MKHFSLQAMHVLWAYTTPDGVRTVSVPSVRFVTGPRTPDLPDDHGAEWAQGTAD